MHYFISAGEPSGDLHAAPLIQQIRALDPEARFSFLGGDLMAEAAGWDPIIHYNRMAFMGFSEVLRHLPEIFSNLSTAKRHIREDRPDALILVDYPSFNLKLAKYAHGLGIPVFYYIAPKVWAWKEWRVKQLRRYVDRILSILPFEEKYFASKGVDVKYVGNPSVEEFDRRLAEVQPLDSFLKDNGLDSRPIIAMVAGSRRGEIKNNLPIMDAVVRRHPDFQGVIAGAPNIPDEFYRQFSDLPILHDLTPELMSHASAALVTSGTATLETALADTPQVVCYRANGVKLSYNIMKHLIKVNYVSLPNLIADEPIIPEMLVHLCTVDSVDRELSAILPSTPGAQAQHEGYRRMRQRLGDSTAARTAASAIVNALKSAK